MLLLTYLLLTYLLDRALASYPPARPFSEVSTSPAFGARRATGHDADAPHERVARAITSARQFTAGQQ